MTDGRTLIDDLRAADGSLDGAAVREILPYGGDFLFVDRVLKLWRKTALFRAGLRHGACRLPYASLGRSRDS